VPEEALPIPVCSSCYFCTLNDKTMEKKKNGAQLEELKTSAKRDGFDK
jgi:hypothetical protein